MNKIKLVEQCLLSVPKENIEVFKENKLIEASNKTSYKARGILKNVVFSTYDENLNGRKYSKDLWEEVAKKKMGEGSLALMGHPENDGNPKDMAGVWHNIKVQETGPVADLYLIGENGSLVLEAVEAGSKIGISSVGYGEFEEDKKTVKAESYELERVGDIVLNPSQQVFATSENMEEEDKEPEKDTIFSENITNKIDNSEKEKNKEVNNMENRLMELNHRNQVKEAIRKCKNSENLKESIEMLSSIETESGDLQKSINDEISNLQAKLNEQRKHAEKSLEEKTKALCDLQEKYDTAVKVVDEFKEKVERANKIQDILEISEEDSIETIEENLRKTEEEFKDIEVMKENIQLMQEDIDAVSGIFEEENFTKMEVENIQDIKNLVEDTYKRDADIEYLYNALKEAEGRIGEYESKLEELGFKFDEKEDEKKDDDKDEKKDDDKDEKKDDEEEEPKEEKKDKKKEDADKTDVEIFVEREMAKKPALKDIEDELNKCESISEAIETIDNFQAKDVDEAVQFNESEETEEEVEVYRFNYR